MGTFKTIKRKNIVDKIHQNLGFSKSIVDHLVKDIFDIITSEFKLSNDVKLSSFGTFKSRFKKERLGRNPKTKIPVKISARNVVTFKASNLLKNKINE